MEINMFFNKNKKSMEFAEGSPKYRIVRMFEKMDPMLNNLNKKKYEQFFAKFEEEYGDLFDELVSSEDVNEAASMFVDTVLESFKGRFGVSKVKVQSAALYLIYYVFPKVLLIEETSVSGQGAVSAQTKDGSSVQVKDGSPTQSSEESQNSSSEEASRFSKALLTQWREKTNNPKFNCATYQEIHDSFVVKFLGMQVREKDD